MTNQTVSIERLIGELADGIRNAQSSANNKKAVIQLDECEIELAVTVSAEAGGGIKFSLLSANAKTSSAKVSKIKLTFSSASKANQFGQKGGRGDAPPNPDMVPENKG